MSESAHKGTAERRSTAGDGATTGKEHRRASNGGTNKRRQTRSVERVAVDVAPQIRRRPPPGEGWRISAGMRTKTGACKMTVHGANPKRRCRT